jgi:transcriptional regulator with XRE-family HTH domain
VPPKKSIPAKALQSPEDAFGDVLLALRVSRQMSQEELAHVSGYSRNFVGLLERGEKSPSLRTLFNLSGSLAVLPSEMLLRVERALLKQGRTI